MTQRERAINEAAIDALRAILTTEEHLETIDAVLTTMLEMLGFSEVVELYKRAVGVHAIVRAPP
jgi:hypothetical protein